MRFLTLRGSIAVLSIFLIASPSLASPLTPGLSEPLATSTLSSSSATPDISTLCLMSNWQPPWITTAGTSSPTIVPGDINRDYKVDIQDLVYLHENWQYGTPNWPDSKSASLTSLGAIGGDINFDGMVNACDFAYFASNFHYGTSDWRGGNPIQAIFASAAPETANAVTPEPGTWAMFMGGAVLLWCLRRRK